MYYSFTITKNFINFRLDKFLALQFPQFSRAYIQKIVSGGKILVNSKVVKPNYQLKENDLVEADMVPPTEISVEADSSIPLDIVYQDDDVVIINKPAGLVVHPGRNAPRRVPTLVQALLHYFPDIRNVGEDTLRPGIVHRLDKDTSGLMVVARHNESFQYLKNLFKNREVEKRYLALVKGNLSNTEGKINLKISRSKSMPTKQSASKTEGREALTYYRVIRRFKGYDLVEASPKTGRMHQIRVHLKALGHPVAGDVKYGHKNQLPGLNRHFLHSYYMKLTLPCGQVKEFKAELPEELKKALKTLTEADI